MNNMIMHDPDLLHILLEEFFYVRELEKLPPTVPALALSIGFFRTQDIVSTLKKWESGDSDYPDRAINYLLGALTRIEDYLLINGLANKMPAALVKFTLGSYHNVKEPEKSEQPTNNGIQIVFEAPNLDHQAPVAKITSTSNPAQTQIGQQPIEIELQGQ